MQVVRSGKSGNVVAARVREVDPGIFLNGEYAAAQFADYTLVTPDNPIPPGQAVLLYGTGLGPVAPNFLGLHGPTEPLAECSSQVAVTVGGVEAEVLFAGLAPGTVGLYQVNIIAPPAVSAGNHEVIILVNGEASNRAVLPVGLR